jgi:hypothetical protein
MSRKFRSFAEFYPFYLSQHRDPICQQLHVTGVLLAASAAVVIVLSGHWGDLWVVPAIGYGLGWIGHLVFEKNRPATFRHPFYSVLGDLLMTWQAVRRWRGRR